MPDAAMVRQEVETGESPKAYKAASLAHIVVDKGHCLEGKGRRSPDFHAPLHSPPYLQHTHIIHTQSG